jgi:hypothetical protein
VPKEEWLMNQLKVEVTRSQRRKRTAQAFVANGKLRVLVPAGLGPDEEAKLIDDMVAKAGRRLSTAEIDLERRARDLAREYRLQTPITIEWSSRQMRRWGSCTPSTGKIRISSRLASMPLWVLDWVIIHELSHLEEANHGPRFRALVGQYELAERAMGYLMARSDDLT